MDEIIQTQLTGPVRLRDALWIYSAPKTVFGRIDDSGGFGWALVTLLALVTLIGYAQVQTGLIDLVVDVRTEERLVALEKTQLHLVDRIEFQEKLETLRKTGEFDKMTQRIVAVIASPAFMLTSILLIASCLYAAVALSGRKPEYNTLVSICVYAAFVELMAYGLRLGLMLYHRTIDVDTSLAGLVDSKAFAWLGAIDPFRIWFWVLVVIGLTVTQQLSRRIAVVSCTLLCLLATGVRAALEYA